MNDLDFVPDDEFPARINTARMVTWEQVASMFGITAWMPRPIHESVYRNMLERWAELNEGKINPCKKI